MATNIQYYEYSSLSGGTAKLRPLQSKPFFSLFSKV